MRPSIFGIERDYMHDSPSSFKILIILKVKKEVLVYCLLCKLLVLIRLIVPHCRIKILLLLNLIVPKLNFN